ncbi:uncharacterized protein YnzC (UPF0291/DUF896 family) [Desulfohalotomaculum tongense]|uniref:DUF896 domain-containing protein n=1 Tax=Desulforadius tongensis TaxID=1216062 RepID=UPI001958F0EB|nr:DUF896 domain-containing protein [Desulforadius tongensis]MBM7855007.1 uncharacterized protein YnzC (UPF0291/DUF896 family) [Desulforadius tongensis]
MTITKELIDKINALARKQRSEGLTEEEKKEQQKLRKIYLQGIRKQVIDQLEKVRFVDNGHGSGCSCGCSHHHRRK